MAHALVPDTWTPQDLLGTTWAMGDLAVDCLPHPLYPGRALLSIVVRDLSDDLAAREPARLASGLRTLLALNVDVLAEVGWTATVSEADELCLSCELSLADLSQTDFTHALAQGAARGHLLVQVWDACMADPPSPMADLSARA